MAGLIFVSPLLCRRGFSSIGLLLPPLIPYIGQSLGSVTWLEREWRRAPIWRCKNSALGWKDN